MSVSDDLRHQKLWIEDAIVIGYHPSRHRQDGTENTQIKKDSAMGRDLQMSEDIWVQNSRQE